MTTEANDPLPSEDTPPPALVALSANAPLKELMDALLRTPEAVYQSVQSDFDRANSANLLLLSVICLLGYGFIMGAFSGGIQWFMAPLKISLGMLFAAMLCYPSLYILFALSGANLRPNQAFAMLLSGLGLTSLLLIGFAPVAFIFTFSTNALPFIGLIHLMIWLISLYFGMRFFIRGAKILGSQDLRIIQVWAFIFVMTLFQMSTTLRPILGRGEVWFTQEKQFFLVNWFTTMGIQ